MANTIDWGESYQSSWWGNVNETNGWGSIYPFDAEGSTFSVDTTLLLADTTQNTADQTRY